MQTQTIQLEKFITEKGYIFEKAEAAVKTAGKLNEKGDNAILLFHAFSGSANFSGLEEKPKWKTEYWNKANYQGWWDSFVGKGKTIDTEKFYVICTNILGGCYGTTGPSSINPNTGSRYGSDFPEISTKDMVLFQKKILDKMGIDKLKAVIGGSLGGMLALEFATLYSEKVEKIASLASAPKISALNKIEFFEQIIAIENDPNFNSGNYYGVNQPKLGLMLARIIASKRYVDIYAIQKRAKKETILPTDYFYNYKLRNNIESYMFHQGAKFVKRFDANTYLTYLKAMQKFDLAKKYGNGKLEKALPSKPEYYIASINSDVCYYSEEQEEIKKALEANEAKVVFDEIHSEKGHDSFLLEANKYSKLMEFLEE